MAEQNNSLEQFSDFDYFLPRSLIAQTPAKPRDSCRLMVLRGDRVEHRVFRDISEYLEDGDTLILNDSRVVPARLTGRKETGGKIEVLVYPPPGRPWSGQRRFEGLVRGRVRAGSRLYFKGGVTCRVVERIGGGRWLLEFEVPGLLELLGEIGSVPLPPYIHTRGEGEDYQTVYASTPGSVAAPTAGLHFTEKLLEELKEKGVNLAFVTLHISPATFLPPEGSDMPPEYYEVTEENARIINNTPGRRIAVGTTTVKVLETASPRGEVEPGRGWSSLFIKPPYKFRFPLDAMITNFHLPRSSLLLLTSAFTGKERLLRAYQEAIQRGYRFYSYGDAMLITYENR